MDRHLTVYSVPKKKGYGPQIRLQGNWLEKAGMSVGDTFTVEVQEGKLVISKDNYEQKLSQNAN